MWGNSPYVVFLLLLFFSKGDGPSKNTCCDWPKLLGQKSKHVASAPMLTVLAQHLLLVASVFKYFKNWYRSNAFANLPVLVFVCIALINVLIPNLGDVMHFNLNFFYFKFIFLRTQPYGGTVQCRRKRFCSSKSRCVASKGLESSLIREHEK